MRIAVLALCFLFAVSTAAQAGQERSHAAGHFAGEIAGEQQGALQSVEGEPPAQPAVKPSTATGGLGTRAAAPLPRSATQPHSGLPRNARLRQPCTKHPCTQNDNSDAVDSVRDRLQDDEKDLEADDKLGNFEIQDLMKKQNQSQTLQSNVKKKKDDTQDSAVRNVK